MLFRFFYFFTNIYDLIIFVELLAEEWSFENTITECDVECLFFCSV